MSHWFDRLAEGAAAASSKRFTRRHAVGAAIVAGVAASPLRSAFAQSYCYEECVADAQDDFKQTMEYSCGGGGLSGPDSDDPDSTGAINTLSCQFGAYVGRALAKRKCAQPFCGDKDAYPPPSGPPPGVNGTWNGTLPGPNSPNGIPFRMELTQSGTNVSGAYFVRPLECSGDGIYSISGQVTGSQILLTGSREAPDAAVRHFLGTIKGETMSGSTAWVPGAGNVCEGFAGLWSATRSFHLDLWPSERIPNLAYGESRRR
jgi:hypothetical protein